MRMLSVLPWLICLGLAAVSTGAAAQAAIHRCVDTDGHPVFTDQPCAALQAAPVTASRDAAGAPARPSSPVVLCAADMEQLKRAVIDAFAAADANRLAGLMLWRGTGGAAAVADIRRLQHLMREPLLDIGPERDAGEDANATWHPAPDLPMTDSASDDSVLVVRTAGNDGSGQPHSLRFTVVRRFGCLWLRSAD